MQAFVTGGSGFVGRRLIARLVERGDSVRALARSDPSARTVREAGAAVVRGDLAERDAMAEGMEGCDAVFHIAAKVDEWGDPRAFERINVQGTINALTASRQADVERFVHASTVGVLNAGRPLRDVDETQPIPDNVVGLYPRTKAKAEELVTRASGDGLATVVVRLPTIWGAGDTTFLPELVRAVETGRFVWFDGGRYEVSTCHVDNAVEGFCRAAAEGEGGEVYHLTDGDPVEFRRFVTDLLDTQGVEPQDRSIPWRLAWWGATAGEVVWRHLRLDGPPPLTRMVVATIGQETTFDDAKARTQLGYDSPVSRAEGLAELRAEGVPQ